MARLLSALGPGGAAGRAVPRQGGCRASHCGAGCTLGDLVAEWLAFAVPAVAVAFGWRGLFGEKTFAVWIAPVDSPEFWFAMQIAMLAGFCTSFPANWLLIRTGVKEAM